MESVVTGQALVILELRNTPRDETQPKQTSYTRMSYHGVTRATIEVHHFFSYPTPRLGSSRPPPKTDLGEKSRLIHTPDEKTPMAQGTQQQ